MKYGDKIPYKNHCLVLNTCKSNDNQEILCSSEKDVLLKWDN